MTLNDSPTTIQANLAKHKTSLAGIEPSEPSPKASSLNTKLYQALRLETQKKLNCILVSLDGNAMADFTLGCLSWSDLC